MPVRCPLRGRLRDSVPRRGRPAWRLRGARCHATPAHVSISQPLPRLTPAAAHDLRFQLYGELPPRLRARVVQDKQAWALSELGFFPPDLPPREKKQARGSLPACLPARLAGLFGFGVCLAATELATQTLRHYLRPLAHCRPVSTFVLGLRPVSAPVRPPGHARCDRVLSRHQGIGNRAPPLPPEHWATQALRPAHLPCHPCRFGISWPPPLCRCAWRRGTACPRPSP